MFTMAFLNEIQDAQNMCRIRKLYAINYVYILFIC